MDGVAYLISLSYEEDHLGQRIPNGENRTEVFVTVDSIDRREWMDAGRNGMKPELKLKTASVNYSGEKEIEYEGTMYSIYRTYNIPDSDEIELYLQRKVGVQNGGS